MFVVTGLILALVLTRVTVKSDSVMSIVRRVDSYGSGLDLGLGQVRVKFRVRVAFRL